MAVTLRILHLELRKVPMSMGAAELQMQNKILLKSK